MSIIEKPMYWAKCDYPECAVTTSDYEGGNGTVYESRDRLTDAIDGRWEGSLADDFGWLRVGDKHYCGDHVEWDEQGDERIPMSKPSETCTCHHVENPWTYYGIVEPGGAMEPDPDCPVHFPNAEATS